MNRLRYTCTYRYTCHAAATSCQSRMCLETTHVIDKHIKQIHMLVQCTYHARSYILSELIKIFGGEESHTPQLAAVLSSLLVDACSGLTSLAAVRLCFLFWLLSFWVFAVWWLLVCQTRRDRSKAGLCRSRHLHHVQFRSCGPAPFNCHPVSSFSDVEGLQRF